MRRVLLVLSLVLPLAGCRIPETRLRHGLEAAGVPRREARCMARRMADRLSIAQLRRLADLSEASASHGLAEFIQRTRSLRDPRVVAVTASASIRCAVADPGSDGD